MSNLAILLTSFCVVIVFPVVSGSCRPHAAADTIKIIVKIIAVILFIFFYLVFTTSISDTDTVPSGPPAGYIQSLILHCSP